MSIVAEFAVPHAEFALAGTFAAVPELVLEAERVVAHPSTRRLSYFWAVGPTTDVEQELRMDPTTMRVSRCTTTDAGALYRIDWQPAITARIEAVLDPDITVLTL
ncbi:MAG: transcriptional regulator, partial [Halorientalis sp.]